MTGTFRDRSEAGELLAERLLDYERQVGIVVVGLPRGGMPVAYEVAKRLRLPLDIFVVRKLGVPGHEELAMGAVATGGVKVMNDGVVAELRIPEKEIDAVVARESAELERREKLYRGGQPSVDLAGRTVILVDDGVATGSTVMAAIEALRKREAGKVVVATPTIAAASLPDIEAKADSVVAVMIPKRFLAVGQWYEDFGQTTDQEVQEYLEKGRHLRAA